MFSDSEVNQRWTSYGRGGIPSATLVYNTRGQSYREVQTAELAKLEPRLAKIRLQAAMAIGPGGSHPGGGDVTSHKQLPPMAILHKSGTT